MLKSFIQDTRSLSGFKGVTFSGFKIREVVKRLNDSMGGGKLENACYWCAELICSGHYMELWECLFQYYCKHVHIANPKLAIYIATKLQRFRVNMNDVETQQEQLDFRNDIGFRNLFIEIVVILCLSPKKYTTSLVKISSGDFNMVTLKDLLRAPDLSFSEQIFKDDDPKELMVTINELAFNLSASVSNTHKAQYWFEWVVEYTKLCKKNKQACKIHKREVDGVDDKYAANPVWLVWDAIRQEATKRGGLCAKIVDGLYTIFSIRYTDADNTRRRLVVYFAITIITTNIMINECEIIKDKRVLAYVIGQVDKIFSQVKEKGSLEIDGDGVDGIDGGDGRDGGDGGDGGDGRDGRDGRGGDGGDEVCTDTDDTDDTDDTGTAGTLSVFDSPGTRNV